jgi:hypothetical protein
MNRRIKKEDNKKRNGKGDFEKLPAIKGAKINGKDDL